jgi:hypothetical protein
MEKLYFKPYSLEGVIIKKKKIKSTKVNHEVSKSNKLNPSVSIIMSQRIKYINYI